MIRLNIDTSHSRLGFSVRHMMISKVRGQFSRWRGTALLDEKNFEKSEIEVTAEIASVTTAEEKRDAHLRSADFFDAEKFPELKFVSKKIRGTPEKFTITGALTLHGVTKEVTLDAEQEGKGKDPWGKARVGYSAKGQINRTDFGLAWNQVLETGGVLVSEKIDVDIEVSAVETPS